MRTPPSERSSAARAWLPLSFPKMLSIPSRWTVIWHSSISNRWYLRRSDGLAEAALVEAVWVGVAGGGGTALRDEEAEGGLAALTFLNSSNQLDFPERSPGILLPRCCLTLRCRSGEIKVVEEQGGSRDGEGKKQITQKGNPENREEHG